MIFWISFVLPKLPGNIILCAVDVIGLYPNNPHKENLSALRKRLDNRMERYITNYTLCYLAEIVFKKTRFLKFSKKNHSSKNEGLESEQTSYLHIVFCLSKNWKKKFFEKQNLNDIHCGVILMICFFWEHGEEKLNSLIIASVNWTKL